MLFLNTSLNLTKFRYLNIYNPYINYSWSQTITVGGNQQIKDTGTAGLNLQWFFGQGVWFNGVDNSISIESVPVSNNMSLAYNFVPAANSRIFGRSTWDTFIGFSTISATEGVVRCRFTGTDSVFTYKLTIGIPYSIVFLLKPTTIELFVNGILRESLAHTFTFRHPLEFIGRNSTAFANCIIKDTYIFNKHLSQIEIEKYTNQPNQFFMDSLVDNSCILAMPMCEKNNLVKNYKNNTNYPIANYLATCRTNAQRLPYGLQTSGFKRDSNGLILSKSNFLEADGVGYGDTGWIASSNAPISIEMIVYYDGGLLNGRHGATNNIYGNQDIKRWFYSLMGAYYSEAIGGTARHINIVVTFDGINTFNFYRDGVFKDVQVITPLSVTLPFYIGMQNGLSSQVATQGVRLFKVNQKVLTQEEITKNFNKYQAQGLLNE